MFPLKNVRYDRVMAVHYHDYVGTYLQNYAAQHSRRC